MSFNRIQKFRSQQSLNQLKSNKTHLSSEDKTFFNAGAKNNPIQKQIEISNKNQFTISTTQSRINKPSSVTLRDYLHLTSNSSLKNNSLHKTRDSNESNTSGKSLNLSEQKRKVSVRKTNRNASGSQIFGIVRNDINKDLVYIKSVSGKLEDKLNKRIKYDQLNNLQMIEIYNFRKKIKQNIVQELANLDKILESLINDNKNEEMPVILEEQQQKRNQLAYSANEKISSSNSYLFPNRNKRISSDY